MEERRELRGPVAILWHPGAIVFLSSACIMTLELVAGRMIAPYVGVSLYTWTSVIGIVLAGMSLGNYLGGVLADRWASPRLLGGVLVASSLTALAALSLDWLALWLPDSWPIVAQILVLTSAGFFFPCVMLGMISPIVVKLAVRDLATTGVTVGKIYAAAAVGSIVGTFATGFVLIAWLGTRAIVGVVAAVLLLLAIPLLFNPRRGAGLLALLLVAGGAFGLRQVGWLESPCTRETHYFCIKVREQEEGGRKVLVLILDRLVHSFVDPDDPTWLGYGYEQAYAELVAYRAREDPDLSAVFIGGGGYTFPRYMEALYPNSRLVVVEIDPAVTEVAHTHLGLPADTRIVTYNEDARVFFARPPDQAYDFVFGDAFNDFSVPYHLTTLEFNRRVKAWLAPDGIYALNIIDGARRHFLRANLRTLAAVFRHVYVVPTTDEWRNVARTTFVLIATDVPLDLAAFQEIDAGDGEPLIATHVLDEATVQSILEEDRAVLLTDDYAPVEQLLAPVVRGEQ